MGSEQTFLTLIDRQRTQYSSRQAQRRVSHPNLATQSLRSKREQASKSLSPLKVCSCAGTRLARTNPQDAGWNGKDAVGGSSVAALADGWFEGTHHHAHERNVPCLPASASAWYYHNRVIVICQERLCPYSVSISRLLGQTSEHAATRRRYEYLVASAICTAFAEVAERSVTHTMPNASDEEVAVRQALTAPLDGCQHTTIKRTGHNQ